MRKTWITHHTFLISVKLRIGGATQLYKYVNTGFLPEQIWVRLPDPTDLPLSDLKILGKNLLIWGEKNC